MTNLSEKHRLILEVESAISPELVEHRGYRTVTNAADLTRLGFAASQANVPGLLLPIWGPHGTEPVSYQYRPDLPRLKDGKPVKYESLPGHSTRLDVPRAVRQKLGDPMTEVWITEGCKKADAAASKGLACVALTGVWNFKVKNEQGGSVILGDFDHVPLKGRKVVICFDSDVMTKRAVAKALVKLRDVLLSRGATVRFCFLPAIEGEKVGLDDYFAAGGLVKDLPKCLRDDFPTHQAIRLADVESEQVEWLWEDYLPQKELTLLAGDGGVGKSYLAMAICKAVTLGQALPGGTARPPADVLFVTDEDHVSRTMKPRAEKLGLDQSKFHVLDLADLDPESWITSVKREIARVKATFVVLDPLQSFLDSGKDLNKTSDVRPLIRRLRELAEDSGATVLVVTHLNKGTGGKAHYRVNGSVDIVNGVRSALMAGWVEVDGEEMQVLAHSKSNYAARGPSLRFTVGEHGFEWLGMLTVGAEDLSTGKKARSKVDDAADFLRDVLANGPKSQPDIEELGRRQAISPTTLNRAKKVLGVKSVKGPGGWRWELHEGEDGQGGQEILYGNVDNLGRPQVQTELTSAGCSQDIDSLEENGEPVGVTVVEGKNGGHVRI